MAFQHELTQKPFIELQIEALAKENYIRSKRVKRFVDELEARVLAISEINYEKLLNRTFRLPLIGRPNSLCGDYPKDFKFLPPTKFHLLGGLKTLSSLKRVQYVDLAVEMPSRCIGQKDVKNQRYQHKRALYLTQLAHLLDGSTGLGLVDKLEFHFFKGDLHKPVLLITPRRAKLKCDVKFQLFVVPCVENFNIRLGLLDPEHGNIAPKWFYQDHVFNTLDQNDELRIFVESDSDSCPSPFYNSSILFDAECVTNSEIISEHIGTKSSISEALIITKIWLYQRELHAQFSYILSMFTAQLHTKQKIHQNMSSYQIFKIIIKSLIETDWAQEGLSYFEDNKENLLKFRSQFPVVFLSPSGKLNLCYNITVDTYNRLRHEAEVANSILASASPDVFEMLFLKKVEFLNKFDVIVHLPKCTKKIPESVDYSKWLMDYGVRTPRVHSQNIMSLIQKSLTDRIKLAQQNPHHLLLDKKWPLKGIPYDPANEEQTFTFGLLLDTEKSIRIIDIGPEAQTDEAEEFRKFWDPKSQLRLQNGAISETVVWHVDSFSQRRTIIKYILDHALRKAQITTAVVHYTQLEKFIELKNVRFGWRDDVEKVNGDQSSSQKNSSKKRKFSETKEEVGNCIGVGEEIYLKILKGYNELNKVLRNIEAMKHSITSVQPVSHHLRSGGIFPPMPVTLQARNKLLKRHKGVTMFPEKFNKIGKVPFIEPIEILVTLDSTSKWASEFELFEAEKLDYLINLGEKLRSKEYTVKFSEDFLDILYTQFVYRVRIRCQKELHIVMQARGKQEFQKRRIEHEVMPRVHGALDQLHREKPAFSLTCRLVKRFISCHLMIDQISDISIDLIVACLFLHPEPFTEPASSACGFKRFLQLMGEHDWKENPLIVNFDNQLKIDEIRRFREALQKERKKYPPMIICTPFDKETPSPWTRQDPSEAKLEMLRKICTKGSEFFVNQILAIQSVNLDESRSLFRPNFKLFNLIIKLHNNVVQTYFMSIDPPKEFKVSGREIPSVGPSALKVMPIVGLNAVEQFVGVLKEKYDEIAWFFYDKYGQRIIGVVMKSGWQKVLDNDLTQFSKEIKCLGSQLVTKVSMVKHES